jgi:hypothetical protein
LKKSGRIRKQKPDLEKHLALKGYKKQERRYQETFKINVKNPCTYLQVLSEYQKISPQKANRTNHPCFC